MNFDLLNEEQLKALKAELDGQYKDFKGKNMHLDMSRGKPSKDQLDISMEMMDVLDGDSEVSGEDSVDYRNYGFVDGIPEAKELFAELMEVKAENVIVGGNSSLNMMYDTVQRAMQFGVYGSKCPWNKLEKVKFLCPAPGYDRHFAICELFGIEMIPIEMTETGPDMDEIEKLVSTDEAVRGIWCVPLYSNPQGISYSDETVKRFAALKPKAEDFRIFWDNAYCVHHIYEDQAKILNIIDECAAAGNPDMVYEFVSTSKITFSGAGVAAMAASKNNIEHIIKLMSVQTIGFDKLNQLRHVRFFKSVDGIREHMNRHAELVRPKFDAVLNQLETKLKPFGLVKYTKPNGGYFISVDVMNGCAKRTVEICKELGVIFTSAGATYPYGKDKNDSNIRIAPTLPPVSELNQAMDVFCMAVKLAAVEKLLEK